MTNPIIVAASTTTANKVGMVSNMSASMMAVYREIDSRYEQRMNEGIDLLKRYKPDSRIITQHSYLMKDVVAICEDILRNQSADSDQFDWDEDIEDFVFEDELGWD